MPRDAVSRTANVELFYLINEQRIFIVSQLKENPNVRRELYEEYPQRHIPHKRTTNRSYRLLRGNFSPVFFRKQNLNPTLKDGLIFQIQKSISLTVHVPMH